MVAGRRIQAAADLFYSLFNEDCDGRDGTGGSRQPDGVELVDTRVG